MSNVLAWTGWALVTLGALAVLAGAYLPRSASEREVTAHILGGLAASIVGVLMMARAGAL